MSDEYCQSLTSIPNKNIRALEASATVSWVTGKYPPSAELGEAPGLKEISGTGRERKRRGKSSY